MPMAAAAETSCPGTAVGVLVPLALRLLRPHNTINDKKTDRGETEEAQAIVFIIQTDLYYV